MNMDGSRTAEESEDRSVSPDIQNLAAEQQEALLRGDERAWREFLELIRPHLRQITCWARWHFDEQTRADILQLIESELPVALQRYDRQSALLTFVRRIAAHKCIDEVRRQIQQRQRGLHDTLETEEDGSLLNLVPDSRDEADPRWTIEQSELSNMLKDLIQSIGEGCNKLLTAFYFDRLSYKQLAEYMGISVNTVSPRLSKCYDKMRRLIEENKLLSNYFGRAGDWNDKNGEEHE